MGGAASLPMEAAKERLCRLQHRHDMFELGFAMVNGLEVRCEETGRDLISNSTPEEGVLLMHNYACAGLAIQSYVAYESVLYYSIESVAHCVDHFVRYEYENKQHDSVGESYLVSKLMLCYALGLHNTPVDEEAALVYLRSQLALQHRCVGRKNAPESVPIALFIAGERLFHENPPDIPNALSYFRLSALFRFQPAIDRVELIELLDS